MTMKSLGDPFSEKNDLRHGASCGCDTCNGAQHDVTARAMSSEAMLERYRAAVVHGDGGRWYSCGGACIGVSA